MNYLNNYPYHYVQPLQPQYQYQPLPNIQNGLNGKIVDGLEMVKATEVPATGFGVFPKGDLSEIYVKSWNNNGTTNIVTFKPIEPAPQPKSEITQLIDKIDALEEKINKLTTPTVRKKEVKANEY